MSEIQARYIELVKMSRAQIVKIAQNHVRHTSAFGTRNLIDIVLEAEFGTRRL